VIKKKVDEMVENFEKIIGQMNKPFKDAGYQPV